MTFVDRIVIAGILGAAPCAALAQQAQVQVVHDNVGGSLLPGESLRVLASISWEGAPQWGGLKGDLVASDDLGAAANVGSEITPGILTTLGVPIGGSVKGFDVAFVPAVFLGGNLPPIPSGHASGVDFLWFDWTAPSVNQPTIVAFEFAADPLAPNVRLYPSSLSPAFIEAPTTYLGTSILVVPAPAGLALLGLAAMGAGRRTRPPDDAA